LDIRSAGKGRKGGTFLFSQHYLVPDGVEQAHFLPPKVGFAVEEKTSTKILSGHTSIIATLKPSGSQIQARKLSACSRTQKPAKNDGPRGKDNN